MIKTGFCVSYDWEYLKTSLPRVYEASDIIYLGVDSNRVTWGMKPYDFNQEEFQRFIEKIDQDEKITIYEDQFSIDSNNSRQNCNRHRMMIAEKMGKGGWHIQVDVDEYFLDFTGFVKFLKRLDPNPTGDQNPYNVLVNLIPLYKKLESGYLYVDFGKNFPESAPFATTRPTYQRARHNDLHNKFSSFYTIHETWARDEDQLWFKINNWGHAAEELESEASRKAYFERWKKVDETNYHLERNIHPANPPEWPALGYAPSRNIEEFLLNFQVPKYPLSATQLSIRNNRNVARIKHLFKRLV